MIEAAAGHAKGEDAGLRRQSAHSLHEEKNTQLATSLALGEELFKAIRRYPERQFATRYEKPLAVVVDREKASFATWYEVFPRSCSSEAQRHGSLQDCERWLPYVASMGFDVVYPPPVHAIGRAFRKGKTTRSYRGRTMLEVHGQSDRRKATGTDLEAKENTPIKRACCSANLSTKALYLTSGTLGSKRFTTRVHPNRSSQALKDLK